MTQPSTLILIGGGARSGKSSMALKRLEQSGPRRGFIATAQAWDDEMRDRILRHRTERDPSISTWEEPLAVAERILSESPHCDAILVDCLTLWLSNLLLAGEEFDLETECRRLVLTAAHASCPVILVTNEVGTGIVPDNALARRFRDEQGRLNQLAAEHAAEVYFLTFGIATRLK
jgi:adenosylcobinamide kinase / adenosylcobinamide-phosphate guanylyltransferase